jgi:hypothetical protein
MRYRLGFISPYAILENGEKVLYVKVLKALYGMLEGALLFYKKLCKDLECIGFKVNPYDPCVANQTVNNKQHTVTWHVDNLKASHSDSKVNDDFLKWLEKMYGNEKVAPVKSSRDKIQDYLVMKLDYHEEGKLNVNMIDYVKGMVEDFPEQVEESVYPWNDNLFKVDEKSPKLSKEKRETFHMFVAKGLFLCNRGRPDIQPAIAYLTSRVKSPNENDWFQLKKMIGFSKATSRICIDVPSWW